MPERQRRDHDEVSKTASRARPAHESALDGPAGEVLRLQTLAGNSAVNALMRSRALQRDSAPPAPKAGEKPKQSGATVTVEGDERLGTFGVDSVHFSHQPGSGGSGGARDEEREKEKEKKRPGEITVTRAQDDKSQALFQWSVKGEPRSVKIEIGGYLTYELTGVLITSYSISGSQDEPIESITFNFTDSKFEYKKPEDKKEPGEKKY